MPQGTGYGANGYRRNFDICVSVPVELEATLKISEKLEDDHVDFNAELELVAA